MAKKTALAAPAPAPASEGYTVLARRYRPQAFADLIGQEPVARALSNALTSNRVAHAYLFTGARGVGKTSTARILAKCLNCENGPTPTPCGICPLCLSIAAGDDVDVVEMDAASNRGIDEIRDIRSNVQYRPSRARFKIYIIDEVHMLTKEAFNALLKTLEEPPAHVKFIFATTDANKLPITILSRCQRFDFAGISLPRIAEQLRGIVEAEGLQAEPEALELVARRAGGSMRDAQSLLDQLLAFASDKLTADQVHHLLGTAGDERVLGLGRGRGGPRCRQGARPAGRGQRHRLAVGRAAGPAHRLLARPDGGQRGGDGQGPRGLRPAAPPRDPGTPCPRPGPGRHPGRAGRAGRGQVAHARQQPRPHPGRDGPGAAVPAVGPAVAAAVGGGRRPDAPRTSSPAAPAGERGRRGRKKKHPDTRS